MDSQGKTLILRCIPSVNGYFLYVCRIRFYLYSCKDFRFHYHSCTCQGCCDPGVTVPHGSGEVSAFRKHSPEQGIKTKKPSAPSKLSHVLDVFRPCVYCGMQIEREEAGKKKNMKHHLACSHSLELSGKNKISSAEFLSNLHLLTEVIKCLRAYNYSVFPACHFFSQW